MGPGAYDISESERDLWKDSMISTVEAIWIDEETDRKNKMKGQKEDRQEANGKILRNMNIWSPPKGTQEKARAEK